MCDDEFLARDVDFDMNTKRGAVVTMLSRGLDLHQAARDSVVVLEERVSFLLDSSDHRFRAWHIEKCSLNNGSHDTDGVSV